MAAWGDGYVTEVQYTGNFYAELAPGFMAFACLRQNVRPPSLGPGSAYLELGCGQGYSLNLLAAANPGMTFWGVDFNPAQIDNARRLARAAGLTNITFEDLSFEQLLALPEGRLPKFDVVALHGVFSWISGENRALVVRILDRVLNPGGIAYVSYNCLPGWAPLIPLQRFVADYAARSPGDPGVRVVDAMHAALRLIEDGAAYFKQVPGLKAHIEQALQRKPAYLAHEYLNGHMHPRFHADVAEELEGARLSFAASLALADDLIHLSAPKALAAQIRDTQDGTWRQTLLDYASGKIFRRDVFVRGRNALGRAERDALLEATRFTVLAPAETLSFEFPLPIGKLTGHAPVYRPIAEALAEGPRSYGDLARLPALAGLGEGILLQAVTLLVGGRRIHPLPADGETDGATSGPRFNRAMLDRLAFDDAPTHLAASLPGTGVAVEFQDLLALKAAMALDGREPGPKDVAAAARDGAALMIRTGRRPLKDGQPITDPTALEAELGLRIEAFNKDKLPLFRALGAI